MKDEIEKFNAHYAEKFREFFNESNAKMFCVLGVNEQDDSVFAQVDEANKRKVIARLRHMADSIEAELNNLN